jgi:predicted transport protein
MAIFKIQNDNLSQIKEVPIKLEKDLQDTTERNLETIFGLDFVSTEFALHQFRIDTLAFDKETNSFVIIEYKKDRSFSIVDQGYSYLALMLNNKADFILEYNENTQQNLRREDVDWSQSKVLFLANSFTAYQQNAINFKDLPIELWEVKKFDNKTILYNRLKSEGAKESIKTISKNKTIQKVSREVKTYSIDDHFKKDWLTSRELFDELDEKISNLDSRIVKNIRKNYIAFKIEGLKWNLCDIHIYKSKIDVRLIRVDKEDLKDPENKIIKIPWQTNSWGKHCSYIVRNSSDIDYAMFLIKQVYKKFYNK